MRSMTIFSESYDFVATLLLLENRDRWMALDSKPEKDMLIASQSGGRSAHARR